jgi:hypothetical protein
MFFPSRKHSTERASTPAKYASTVRQPRPNQSGTGGDFKHFQSEHDFAVISP